MTFFSLFMGSQSSRKSNMVEMSVPICDGCGYFLLIFNDSFLSFSFKAKQMPVEMSRSVCVLGREEAALWTWIEFSRGGFWSLGSFQWFLENSVIRV